MIEVLLYNLEKPQREIFHFSEMTTLEVTTLLDDTTKIKSAKIVAYHKNDYLGQDVLETFTTIEDFNRFFMNNRRYYLHDRELSLEDDVKIYSHDDGEVSIYMPMDYKNRTLINGIFHMKGLSETLIEEIMKMPGYYFSLNEDGKIESTHKTFDDYLNRDK
jgi:hypothetical protein